MNINDLFLTKFKCLFNKNYQKIISKSELKDEKRKLKKYTSIKSILFLPSKTSCFLPPVSGPLNNINNP